MEELFLIPIAGIQYGIWKDDILSVRSLDALHSIPFSPARIAGIMIDGDHTVTLANLPICIGFVSTERIEQGCILLTEEGDKLLGFVVGELCTQSISPQLLFQLPDCLKSPVFDTCAVHDNIPIPLINIAELQSRVLKPGEDTTLDALRISGIQPLEISGMNRIRFFYVGGELFAASATGMEDIAFKPGPITPLPHTPQYVKGITFGKGRLLPVIDLSQRIKSQGGSPESMMLEVGIGDTAFGLLIDSDGGAVPFDKVAIEPVPFIARRAWLKHVVVRSGELIPLIDLPMALLQGSADDEKPIWQRYAPDSVFPEIFFKREVEVVEFSLLGERYALPKNEVEDVISFKPCRALSDLPPIVIGVAEHNGEILPVVDLAIMFGRRSLATPTWRMMLVKNGNFRALVVTEAVSGGRRLPPEIHRTVPIHLPHNLLYGCYPDGKAAIIILNVEAMSVHFETSLIKKFLPTLTHEMRISPAGGVYAFPGEKTLGTPQPLAAEAPAGTQATPKNQTRPETIDQAVIPAFVKIIVPDRAEKDAIRHAEVEPAEITRQPKSKQIIDASDVAPPAGAHLPLPRTGGVSARTVSEQVHVTDEAPAETISKSTIAPEMHVAEAEVFKPVVPPHKTSNQRRSSESNTRRESAVIEVQLPDVGTTPGQEGRVLVSPKQGNRAQKASPSVPNQAELVQNFVRPCDTSLSTAAADKMDKSTTDPAPDSGTLTPIPAVANPDSGRLHRKNREVEQISMSSAHEEQTSASIKYRISYGTIIAALISALLYFSGTSEKHGVEKSVKASEPAKIEQTMGQPAQAPAMTVSVETRADLAKEEAEQAKARAAQTKVQTRAEQDAKRKQALELTQQTNAETELAHPMDKTHAPLELVIPKNVPKIDINEYVVVQGDTLWSISVRFTGNPFNYPRIAGENRIANPDLIFPGQRISLIK